uniref:DUF4220 domain-containing protein n=3 Tax=Aegilops tauschii subsp. strangulata TaxID=200361 RepID=A0A453HJY8_AEGTS
DPSHLSLRAALHRIPASYRILPSQVGCKSVYGDYIARLARCYFSGQPRRRMAGRARATGIRGNSGDGPKKRQREEMSLNRYAAMQAYLLMGVTGLGYLALLWSTVVLLGGFVTALGKKDFWCLTAISMIQAARFFNDWEEKVLTEVLTSKKKPPSEASQRQFPWWARLLMRRHLSVEQRRKRKSKASGDVDENPQQDDEENQHFEHNSQINLSEQKETHTATMELKEALLSLTLVICDKLIISADDFDDVARNVSSGEGQFVAKLKTVVEENCEATANSLRIVSFAVRLLLQ